MPKNIRLNTGYQWNRRFCHTKPADRQGLAVGCERIREHYRASEGRGRPLPLKSSRWQFGDGRASIPPGSQSGLVRPPGLQTVGPGGKGFATR